MPVISCLPVAFLNWVDQNDPSHGYGETNGFGGNQFEKPLVLRWPAPSQVFELLKSKLPKQVFVFSDMQFAEAGGDHFDEPVLRKVQRDYEKLKLELPELLVDRLMRLFFMYRNYTLIIRYMMGKKYLYIYMYIYIYAHNRMNIQTAKAHLSISISIYEQGPPHPPPTQPDGSPPLWQGRGGFLSSQADICIL